MEFTGRSISDFKRNTRELIERMKESGNPMTITINGKTKLVAQDIAPYEKILEELDEAQAVQGIRRGREDVATGRTQPVSVPSQRFESSGSRCRRPSP